MNYITLINTCNSDNRNITRIKTRHRQIMATITNRILRFERMIKVQTVVDNTFFTVITFIRINSFTYINSVVIEHF